MRVSHETTIFAKTIKMKEILKACKGKEIFLQTAGGVYVIVSKNQLQRTLSILESSTILTHKAIIAEYQPSQNSIFIDFKKI